jgi:drug/metabolite transporter (DMT)-like permease
MFADERLGLRGWGGLATSAVGAVLVALGGRASSNGHSTVSGDALVGVSLIAAVAWVLTSQRLIRRGLSSVVTSALVICVGTVMLAVVVLATIGPPRSPGFLRSRGSR